MDLSAFVKETLLQISTGVRDAQEEIRKLGGVVNPSTFSTSQAGGSFFATLENGHHVFLVDFDLALVVSESSGSDAGAKLKIASLLDIGGGVKEGSSTSSTSRVSFKVPIAFPPDQISKDHIGSVVDRNRAKVRAHNLGLDEE